MRGSTQSDTVNVRGNWAPGNHDVVVDFLNDAFGGTAATEGNLYDDGATYNGAAVSAAGHVIYAGLASFSFTDLSPIA